MNDTAFQPDDRQDRALASDQKSRYGAYLAHTTQLFRCDGDEQPPTMCAVRFAIAAWTAAGPPVMAPGYVRTHPRIQRTGFHWDDTRAALEVHIAVPAPLETKRLTSHWVSWHRDSWSMRWHDPYLNDSVTALTTLAVRIPLRPERLPPPQYTGTVPQTSAAKASVAALCRLANSELDELLAAVDANPHHPAQRL